MIPPPLSGEAGRKSRFSEARYAPKATAFQRKNRNCLANTVNRPSEESKPPLPPPKPESLHPASPKARTSSPESLRSASSPQKHRGRPPRNHSPDQRIPPPRHPFFPLPKTPRRPPSPAIDRFFNLRKSAFFACREGERRVFPPHEKPTAPPCASFLPAPLLLTICTYYVLYSFTIYWYNNRVRNKGH